MTTNASPLPRTYVLGLTPCAHAYARTDPRGPPATSEQGNHSIMRLAGWKPNPHLDQRPSVDPWARGGPELGTLSHNPLRRGGPNL